MPYEQVDQTALAAIPVVDAHCHPFPPEQVEITAQQLRDAIAVALRGPTSELNESMLLARLTIRGLARLLGCEATWPAVIEARNAAARADKRAYHRRLFADANVGLLLVDPGYPPTPTISAEAFAAVLPCPVYEGFRIERFWAAPSYKAVGYRTLPDFVEAFRATLDAELAKPSTRFVKSVIAYRSGLAIQRVSEAQALAAWRAHARLGDPASKVLNDYTFRIAALAAREHDRPFQVHTGHVSHVRPWPEANPTLLCSLLEEPDMQDVRFVLVHGGYPYCAEAGYLTSVYRNVALDLSLMIPWSSWGIAGRIEETLEAAPSAKVMYGSDGIHVPELYWIAARNARRALGRVLDRLIADDVVDPPETLEIAQDILRRNAERIYGVKLTADS